MRRANSMLATTIVIVFCISCGVIQADELYVPSQYTTIQAAINDANDGDIVLIADNTYTGEGNRDIDFLGKAITVKSENGPANCIIDCDGTEDDQHRGFYFHNGEDTNSVLDGLTIQNGYADNGGAIYCKQAAPTITNCNIIGNKAFVSTEPVSPTGNALDMAIEGQGYFVLDDGSREVFTRRGAFAINANLMLVDPKTGYHVQRIGSAGEDDYFQTPGDSNLYVPYDIALPAGATSVIEVAGNLSADNTLDIQQTQILRSNLRYTIHGTVHGYTTAATFTKIVDLDQFNGTPSDGKIYVTGIKPDGTAVTDVTGLTIFSSTTIDDLLTYINSQFGLTNAIASLSNGKIRITDSNPGYSRTEILLSYESGGSETLITPAYFEITTVGGEEVKSANIIVYDSLGGEHVLSAAFVRTNTPNTWDMVMTSMSGNVNNIDFGDRRIEGIEFNGGDGSYAGLNSIIGDTAQFVITFAHGTLAPQTIAVNLGIVGQYNGLTQFATTSTAVVKDQDGYESGALTSVSVSSEGIIIGSFSSGLKRDIARIQLALFNDPDALKPASQYYFIPTSASGSPIAAGPGDNGAGTILGGHLENIDDDRYDTQGPNRGLDGAIDGEGYFVLDDGQKNLFTRIGSFDSDANSILIDPATGYKVQRIGSVGQDDGYQLPGDSNIHISYDMSTPAKPTSEIVIWGNLSADNIFWGMGKTNVLRANTAFTASDDVMATAFMKIADLDQFSGIPSGGKIYVDGIKPDGTEVIDSTGLSVSAATTIDDLLSYIDTKFGVSNVTASISNGKILVTDNNPGYSKTDIAISYTAGSSESLVLPGYFEVTNVGGEEVTNVNIIVYDSQGSSHVLSAAFTRTDTINIWDMVMTSMSGNVSSIAAFGDRRIEGIEFNGDDGSYAGLNSTIGDTAQFVITFAHDTSNPQTIAVDMGTPDRFNGLTQFAASSTPMAREQDGYPAGQLRSVAIGTYGSVYGSFSNGIKKELATIQLALFQNPEYLEALDNGYFAATTASGDPFATQPGENGAGTIINEHLEDPNAERYYTQWGIVHTDRTFDMAIWGERYYFVLNDDYRDIFTHIGSFELDADGILVEPVRGYKVQRIGSVGEENGYQIPGDSNIHISYDMLVPAKPTSEIIVKGNLSADDPDAEKDISITIFDSQGDSHVLSATFVRAEILINTWTLVINSVAGEIEPVDERRIEGITFTPSDGSYAGLSDPWTDPSFDVKFPFAPDAAQTISFFFGTPDQYDGLMQFANNSTAEATKQDGYEEGTLSSVSVNSEGILTGTFSNDIKSDIAQIKLATFPAPWALETIDHGYFVPTTTSGQPIATQVLAGATACSIYGGGLLKPTVKVHRKGNSFGGGIYATASAIIKNCLIAGNSSDNGGGIYCQSDTTIENCTISGNRAVNTGGGVYCSIITGPTEPFNLPLSLPEPKDTVITNSILFANTAEQGPQLALESIGIWLTPTGIGDPGNQFEPEFPGLRVTYSDIQGGEQGVHIEFDDCLIWDQGNIDEDPLFADAANSDYRLFWDSPCIDAGDPNYTPEPNETDLDSNRRVLNGRIDIGVYESDYIRAQMQFVPQVIKRHSRSKRILAIIRLPEGIDKADVDSDVKLTLYPGGIEAKRQFIHQRGRRPVIILAFFDKKQLLDAIESNGPVMLKAVGQLKTGQYFYGEDSVTIRTRRRPKR